MKIRRGICDRKIRYPAHADALGAALSARGRGVRLAPMRCPLCHGWHLTSRTKGMWLPKSPP